MACAPVTGAKIRSNPVKAALKEGKASVGTWLSFGDPFATRIMSRVGFPWLTVDMEHSAIDWKDASILFALIADAGCTPLCRVPKGTHENIKRALDAGAHGIVVPMVNTVAEAKEAIAAAKYPPEGNRSVGGGSHFLNFDTTPNEYYAKANEEILVVLQTESPEGVDNAPEIYTLPGVDAIFVGPNDMRAQMRNLYADGRAPTVEEYEAVLDRILAAGKGAHCPVGLHTFSVEECEARVAAGWQFVALQSEQGFMTAEALRAATALGLHGGREFVKY
jgi:4-hydroxy-2-oxoheptanedioate aldolase